MARCALQAIIQVFLSFIKKSSEFPNIPKIASFDRGR